MTEEQKLAVKAFVEARRQRLATELAQDLAQEDIEKLAGVTIDDLLIVEGSGYMLNLETGNIEPEQERWGLQ